MITHDFKLIFTHIPKCAGRSVCDLFSQRFDHYTSHYYATEYNRFWQDYKRMTIIRNPFDRMVSLYIYIKEHRRHFYERIAITPGEMPSFKLWLKTNINQYQGDFNINSAEGNRGTDGDIGSMFWFSSQKRRLSDENGNLYPQKIFRLEDGTTDIENFLFCLTGINAKMPHVNKSEYSGYQSFYTPDLVEMASEFPPIAEDCQTFNYKF